MPGARSATAWISPPALTPVFPESPASPGGSSSACRAPHRSKPVIRWVRRRGTPNPLPPPQMQRDLPAPHRSVHWAPKSPKPGRGVPGVHLSDHAFPGMPVAFPARAWRRNERSDRRLLKSIARSDRRSGAALRFRLPNPKRPRGFAVPRHASRSSGRILDPTVEAAKPKPEPIPAFNRVGGGSKRRATRALSPDGSPAQNGAAHRRRGHANGSGPLE